MIDQHKTLAEKFLKKWFWLYLFSFILAPIWYIIKIIISGELTVSEVGILYGIISLITMISAYNDLWMTESLKYFIPQFVAEKRYDKVKTLLFFALFIQIISSLIIAAIFYFWSSFIAENYFKTLAAKETLQIFAFFFIGLNIFQTLSQFFLAIQDTYHHQLSEFIRLFFVMISVFYILFWNSWSLLNYSFSWLIGLYIWIISSIFIFLRKYYFKYLNNTKILIEKKFLKKVTKYALLVAISTWAWTILSQIDMQMIIIFLNTTDAWYYTNYLSIITIPFIILWPVFGFLFPVVSELYWKKEYKKIQLLKNIFSNNFIIFGIMFNLFFFIFSNVIAYILFWEKFIESGNILQYSILLVLFNFLLQINFSILSWIWKVKERMKIIFIAIIFNTIVNFIGIQILWVYWVALSTWLWWILIYLLSENVLRKKFKTHINYYNIIKNIIFMWWIWIIFHYYVSPIFINNTRFESLLLLWITFIVWSIIFIIFNINVIKNFIDKIKKIKQWNIKT